MGIRVLLLLIQSGDRDMGGRGVVKVGPRGESNGWGVVSVFLLLLHNMGDHPSYNPPDLIKIYKTWEQEGQTFYAEDLANDDK